MDRQAEIFALPDRQAIHDGSHFHPHGPRFGKGAIPPLAWGQRDRGDPTYPI